LYGYKSSDDDDVPTDDDSEIDAKLAKSLAPADLGQSQKQDQVELD
jgi:hypothetical protein